MTPIEHYREAERWLQRAEENYERYGGADRDFTAQAAIAQVHADLANARCAKNLQG